MKSIITKDSLGCSLYDLIAKKEPYICYIVLTMFCREYTKLPIYALHILGSNEQCQCFQPRYAQLLSIAQAASIFHKSLDKDQRYSAIIC